jgi:glycosyltransferase involved in cell wall biosynthesis
MKLSLIILTYNRPDALALVLRSTEKQTVMPDEVIIADDGSSEETRSLVRSWQKKFPVPLHHVWHEDRGYRISAIRNLAVKRSSGELLIFSDGDLFFHPRFIEDFKRNVLKGYALIGSRVFLTRPASRRRLKKQQDHPVFPLLSSEIDQNRINSVRIPCLNRFLKPLKYSENLRGGLLGIRKEDLAAVNGWNEEFIGWGLEDTELVTRLFNYGIRFKKIKFQAITYHLWHKIQARDQISGNRKLLEETIEKKLIRCRKGLVSLD